MTIILIINYAMYSCLIWICIFFPLSIHLFPYIVMNDMEAYIAAYIFIVDDENRHGCVILFNKIHTTIYLFVNMYY